MPEAIHIINREDKIIEIAEEYKDFTIVYPRLEVPTTEHITYTTIIGDGVAKKVKEYRCLVTVLEAASFPLTLYYKDLQDVYGHDLPMLIEDAFVFGAQAVGFKREIRIDSYTDYELVLSLGSRGESRNNIDIQITFVIKEGE